MLDQKPEERQERTVCSIANNVKIKKKNTIDILVASGGLAEGHDIQDADFIINFDYGGLLLFNNKGWGDWIDLRIAHENSQFTT